MIFRTALGAAAALALCWAGAAPGAFAAAKAKPLAGTGQNIQAVATLEIGDGQKNEIELAGDYAYISWDGGMTIVNISNPANPTVEGVWKCAGGWADIDLNAQATIAVLANGHDGYCPGSGTAATIVDISDKRNPQTLAKIDLDDEIEYTHTTTLDNTTLYLNPQIWLGYPQTATHVAVYDIANPANPVRKGFIESQGPALAHDTYVDHRPDGKTLMYAASMHTTDVFDVTNGLPSMAMQRILAPEITLSHQIEPNFDRTMLIVDDESAVDVGAPVGAICGRVGGPGPAALDIGSVHFYAAAADGTFANQGLVELGSWNTPVTVTPDTCTGHVFWTAPDQNRLVNAWYSEGAHVLDFDDPAAVKDLGNFKAADGTMYWSAKPHRGYIYATDMERGLDVLRYTGEGGSKWPATDVPAELQRAARMGVKLPGPLASTPAPPGRRPGRVRSGRSPSRARCGSLAARPSERCCGWCSSTLRARR